MVRVGTMVFGYAGGLFGRDSYGDKRVEAIGHDWVVIRNEVTGLPEFASVDGPIEPAIEPYLTPSEDDDV